MTSMSGNTPAGLASAYDDWHTALGKDDGLTSPWHELVIDRLGAIAGLDVLEIGCGRGGFTRWLALQSPRLLIGADFSHVAVDLARGLVDNPSAKFQVADICRIPVKAESYDVVISCETVEHVLDPAASVRELYRVLRPGGRLILTTPNYFNLLGLYRGYLRAVGRRYTEHGQPVNNFTSIPRVRSWLSRAGFRLVEVTSLGHYIPWPGRRPIRVLALDDSGLLASWLGHHSVFVAERN